MSRLNVVAKTKQKIECNIFFNQYNIIYDGSLKINQKDYNYNVL